MRLKEEVIKHNPSPGYIKQHKWKQENL